MCSCAGRTPELLPEAARYIEFEKVRRRGRILIDDFVRGDREDAFLLLQCRRLFGGELRSKAIVANCIIVDLLATADLA